MSIYGIAKTSEFERVSLSTAAERVVEDYRPSISLRSYAEQSGLLLTCLGNQPMPALDTASRRSQLRIKRVMDVVLSLAALVLLCPLLLLVALAIGLTSGGPILFRQVREGYLGRPFTTYKFRTMWNEAGDASGVSQTVPGDRRVTPVGRMLRRTSIDELPQLFNVLRGDMSLVGPRPHVAGMRAAQRSYTELVPYYGARLAMRPGITGWAQANGLRGPTGDEVQARARIDHDIAYIQNFSLALDAKIIALTLVREFISGNGD